MCRIFYYLKVSPANACKPVHTFSEMLALENIEKIKQLFLYCDRLYKEFSFYPLGKERDPKWDYHRYNRFVNGPILGLLRERDLVLKECLDMEPNLCLILALLVRTDKSNIENIKRFCEHDNEEPKINESKVIYCTGFKVEEFLIWLLKQNCHLLEDAQSLNTKQKIMFLELYFGYEFYSKRKSKLIEIEQPAIDLLYKDKELEDTDYEKYQLIPINQERELLYGIPYRIYDKAIDKTIFLQIEQHVAEVLEELKTGGYIGRFSFRGCNEDIYDGYFDISVLLEELAYGKKFTTNLLELSQVTQLYSSDYYNDQLWVTVNVGEKLIENEITFEELYDNNHFKFEKEDAVVTQMIHLLCHKDITGKFIITHIDHEYLFYGKEAYENRKKDSKVKGTERKRIKTFKINNATIPFDYPCKVTNIHGIDWQYGEGIGAGVGNEKFLKTNNSEYNHTDGVKCESAFGEVSQVELPFIYFIVCSYFKNTDLVNEYFGEYLK